MQYNRTHEPIQEGDELEVMTRMWAVSGYRYDVGMHLYVIAHTTLNPFNIPYTPQTPYRWVVKCPFQTSIWSSLEDSLSCGILRKVEKNNQVLG